MRRFAILLDGPCEPTDALRLAVGGHRSIAADGGMRHAAALGLVPELWVGDFDGAPDALIGAHDTPRETHPVGKDETDGAIAVEAALKRGATSLLLVGALGGPRVDHALGLVTLATAVAERGIEVALTDGRQWALPLLPGRPLDLERPGRTLSVIGLGDLAGLTLRGVRWPLAGVDVPFGSSLTLSNETVGPVRATVNRGRAILVHGPGDGAEPAGSAGPNAA